MLSHIIFQNKAVKSKNKFSSQNFFLLANFNTNFAILQTVFLSMIIAFQKNSGQDCIRKKKITTAVNTLSTNRHNKDTGKSLQPSLLRCCCQLFVR